MKLVKRTRIISHQPKPIEIPNITDIKQVNMKHSKSSHKLSKAEQKGFLIGWCFQKS